MQELKAFGGFLRSLCLGDAQDLARRVRSRDHRFEVFGSCTLILVGGACYGASIGLWRAPLQSGYAAIKMPLVIFLTILGNGLLNSILAMVLGSGLSFRQTSLCLLLSFALFALIVGSISPVALFLSLNTPAPQTSSAIFSHSFGLLTHTFFIAYAGVLSNWKLLHLLETLAPSAAIARQTVFAWLAGNLFLGAQFSWILRPFFGNPAQPVQFLRAHPLQGSFYEIVYDSFLNLFR